MEAAIENRRTPAVWIATVAGAGHFPLAPGTIGSAVGVAVVLAINTIPIAQAWRDALTGVTALFIFFLGVWAAGVSEKFFQRTDPGCVVIDEVAGQMITFLLLPYVTWKVLLVGFAFFRFFDVAKPFPARRAERLTGGWGIMVDDVIAGAYALGALALVGYIIK